jgi:hypothetical protein
MIVLPSLWGLSMGSSQENKGLSLLNVQYTLHKSTHLILPLLREEVPSGEKIVSCWTSVWSRAWTGLGNKTYRGQQGASRNATNQPTLHFGSDDGGIMFLWNVGTQPKYYMVQQPRSLLYIKTCQMEPGLNGNIPFLESFCSPKNIEWSKSNVTDSNWIQK